MRCPVCNNRMLKKENLKEKTNTPNVLSEIGENVQGVDLQLYQCPYCGHGTIDNILSENFYEEFTVAIDDKQVFSDTNVRNARFEKFLTRLIEIGKNRNSLLEVGSGYGCLLKTAMDFYKNVVGVEPSKLEAEIAKKMGLTIICDYFTSEIVFEKQFSAFISTMVFEHLPNPREAIKHIYDNLEYDGVGMIQVPNGQRAFSNGIYFDIYPQHLHYYTLLSLCKLVTDAGFDVLSLQETENRNYIEIYVKKPEKKYGFCERAENDTEFITNKIKEHNVTAVWGASYAARSYMRFLPEVHYIFDVSASKIGGFIVGSTVKIGYPEKKQVESCDLIIIMANEYTKEIEKSIHENYKYNGEIVYFDQENNLCSKWINNK